ETGSHAGAAASAETRRLDDLDDLLRRHLGEGLAQRLVPARLDERTERPAVGQLAALQYDERFFSHFAPPAAISRYATRRGSRRGRVRRADLRRASARGRA